MFKSINMSSGRPVVILDPQWDSQIHVLRTLANQDLLVCQECNQPVRVRAGGESAAGREGKRIIRRHFAHKHKQDCTYGAESYKILRARAVLYDFLYKKFGQKVTLEKKIEDSRFFRAVDCWVELDDKIFAYWIFDGGLKAQKREDLVACFRNKGVHIHWIFDSSVLKVDDRENFSVNLSSTERFFMRSSQYDITPDKWKKGASLHYIDSEQNKLITYRSLYLVHSPQQHDGYQKYNFMSALLISPINGEFVHPGEHELFKAYEEQEQIREEFKKTQEERYLRNISWDKSNYPLTNRFADSHKSCDVLNSDKLSDIEPVQENSPQLLRCKVCGALVDRWWMEDHSDNTCKCYNCYGYGKR
jgi:competence CoiA-like predicted nuclease